MTPAREICLGEKIGSGGFVGLPLIALSSRSPFLHHLEPRFQKHEHLQWSSLRNKKVKSTTEVEAHALGVYMTLKSPGHRQPTTIGGSAGRQYCMANIVRHTIWTSRQGSSTRLHVTPRNAVARRSPEDVFLTPAPALPRHLCYECTLNGG